MMKIAGNTRVIKEPMRVPGMGQKSQFPKTAFFNVVFYRVPAIRRGYEHDTYPLRSYAYQAAAASRLTNEAAQGPSLRKKLEEMSDAGADDDDDGSGAHASKSSEEVAPALPPPQLPEWKANALPYHIVQVLSLTLALLVAPSKLIFETSSMNTKQKNVPSLKAL